MCSCSSKAFTRGTATSRRTRPRSVTAIPKGAALGAWRRRVFGPGESVVFRDRFYGGVPNTSFQPERSTREFGRVAAPVRRNRYRRPLALASDERQVRLDRGPSDPSGRLGGPGARPQYSAWPDVGSAGRSVAWAVVISGFGFRRDQRYGGAMIQIAIINESTVISGDAVQAMIPAFQTQWTRDLAPVWDLEPAQFNWSPGETAGRQLVGRVSGRQRPGGRARLS